MGNNQCARLWGAENYICGKTKMLQRKIMHGLRLAVEKEYRKKGRF